MPARELIARLRVALARFLWRLILGGVAGRLPRNCLFSIQESRGLDRVAQHLVDIREWHSEEIVQWNHSRDLPPWVRRSFAFGKREMFLVRNVLIGPRSGAIWTTSGDVLAESIGSLNKILTFGKVLPELCLRPKNTMSEVRDQAPDFPPPTSSFRLPPGQIFCLPLSGCASVQGFPTSPLIPCPSASYFHWLLEVLRNVIPLMKTFPGGRLIVHPNRPAYIDAGLRLLFDLQPGDKRMIESTVPVQADYCAFATMPTASGFVRPADAHFVRTAILEKLGKIPSESATRRIFISRRGSKARTPENQDEIEERFRKEGYEILQLETLPWIDQIAAFRQASHVAGFHGAGFSNMIFCPPSCQIHEIFPTGYTNDCYSRLASGLGMTYSLVQPKDRQQSIVLPK